MGGAQLSGATALLPWRVKQAKASKLTGEAATAITMVVYESPCNSGQATALKTSSRRGSG